MSITIHTKRLILRRWLPEDLYPFQQMCSDPEVMRWIGDGAIHSHAQGVRSIQKFEDEWDTYGFGLFALETINPSSGSQRVGQNHVKAWYAI